MIMEGSPPRIVDKMKDVQGVQRGKCNACGECDEYRAPSDSKQLRCEYCNHTPGEHVKIIELGACQKCGDCGQYLSEDPNSYTECQYCGCDANQHAGAEKLRKPQPQTQPMPMMVPQAFPQYQSPAGAVPIGGGIQPRVSSSGQPLQISTLGTCVFPGCPYPRRVEGNKVHDYCSRTCARKDGEQKAALQMQSAAVPAQAAQDPGRQKVLVQAKRETIVVRQPGHPPQAATLTTISATKLPAQPGGDPTAAPQTSVRMCSVCGRQPPNPGHGWCHQCYVASKNMMP